MPAARVQPCRLLKRACSLTATLTWLLLASTRRSLLASAEGEASRQRELTPQGGLCYQTRRRGYTFLVWDAMADEIDTAAHDRITAAYERHYDLLRFIAGQRFKIPAADVRPLIHDVFVAYMRHEHAIGDSRRWLTTSVSNACRNYWRDMKPDTSLPAELLDPRELADECRRTS